MITPKFMGVINITPNSFSNTHPIVELDSFKKKWQELAQWCDIIDIGAESTAPFNDPISLEDEWQRWQMVLPYLKSQSLDNKILSVDTYKVELFERVYHELQGRCELIFNDISGVLDHKLISLLNSDLNFSYVYSHNLVPTREVASFHMDYIAETDNEQTLQNVRTFFDQIKVYKFKQKIYLDPSFGFSKNREQNHGLLSQLDQLLDHFDNDFIIGLSRKSFLRKPHHLNAKDPYIQNQLDQVQAYFIAKYSKYNDKLVYRVHDERVRRAFETFNDIISS